MSHPPGPSFSTRRRWQIGANVIVSILSVLAIGIMVNYLAARHFRRFQWSAQPKSILSPATADILRSVTNKVRVIVFFDRTKPLYDLVADLLEQYRVECPKLELEFVDYMRSPGRAKQIQDELGMGTAEEGDRILFDAGGKRRVVYARDLSEYDYAALLKGQEVKRTGFKGEQLFTSALFSLLDAKTEKAYFLTGHREHDPTDADDQNGYLKFAKTLAESQVPVARLDLEQTTEVPPDCQVLIIANPIDPLRPEELSRIEKYISQGGRMFVLLSASTISQNTGLEPLLSHWGVTVGRDCVIDPLQGQSGDSPEVIVSHFANHPIVNPLMRSRMALIRPRSVSASTKNPQGADAPKVVELATTSPQGVASLGPGRIETENQSIPLMAAVEQGAIQGISTDRGTTRIVVVGDSYFLTNLLIEQAGNRDFGRNAVNWLLNRDLLVQGIGTQPIKEYRITMTTSELNRVRWLFIVVFPGAVLFLGFLVWARRRS